jgi:3-dehydroquinate dehydratase/shikimate dehydrogenase
MAEVIVSLFARDPDRTIKDARRAAMAGADWVELRLDEWPKGHKLGPVVDALRVPLIAACRMPRDGGRFRGTNQERIALLEHALEAGVQGVDIEDWETWAPRGDAVRLLIRSHHDQRGIPKDLRALRERLLDRGADVAKIVGRADDLADAAPLLELLASTDPDAEPTVAFATGAAASVTRVLACALGAPFGYASLVEGEETALGQLPVADAVGLYRMRTLGLDTQIFGLLGQPARHSLGPWLHNRAFRAGQHDAVYLALESSRPKDVLAMLPHRRVRGMSVTAPFKETALAFCHRLDPVAEIVGAVNTLSFEAHDLVVGHNTDVAGVREGLRRAGLSDGAGAGVVLGGGGAARAAALALEQLGLEVTVCARSLDTIREFAKRRGYRLGALRGEVLTRIGPKVVVHATPVGSRAHGSEGERVVPDWVAPPGVIVADMVYRPQKTRLLVEAAAAGARVVSGLELFLVQAAEQLRIFFGERVDEDELRRYLAGVD